MKKILSYVISLSMLFAIMSVSANAAYLGDTNHVTADTASNSDTAGIVADSYSAGDQIGSANIPVYITAATETNTTNVYALSYDMSELVFVFNGAKSQIWNPETLMYESTKVGTWNTTTQDITVKNYSDLAVKVTPSNTTPTDSAVTVTLGAALELGAAFDGDYDAAGTVKSGTISVAVSGTPENDYDTKTLLTTITLVVTDNRA